MEFKMTVEMDNAAFTDGAATELRRILAKVSEKVGRGEDSGKIMDVNGNSVGYWEVG